MRRALAALTALAGCLAGCAAPKPTYPPPPFAAAPAPEPKRPNFELTVTESVPSPDEDGLSFTRVIVDGVDKGQTPVGRKSQERTFSLQLSTGNMPVRLEQWALLGADWQRLDDSRQPRERFVRIEPGTVAKLKLHFAEREASHSLSVTRQSAP